MSKVLVPKAATSIVPIPASPQLICSSIVHRYFRFLRQMSCQRLQRPVGSFRLMLCQLQWIPWLSLTTVRRSWSQEARLAQHFY